MEHLGYLAPGQTALAPGDPKRRCRAPRCFFLKGGLVDVSIVFMGYEWKYMEISMGYNGYEWDMMDLMGYRWDLNGHIYNCLMILMGIICCIFMGYRSLPYFTHIIVNGVMKQLT